MIVEPYPAHASLFVSSLGKFSAFHPTMCWGYGVGDPGTSAWPAANLALYIPIVLPYAYPAKRVWWVNGATASGNVDLGVYSSAGTRLFSTGATAQAGTNAPQYVTVDWLVQPGEYYLALSLSSSTGTVQRSVIIPTAFERVLGGLQQATAHPLPSSMTPAALGQAFWPLFGLTRTTTGF